MVSSSDKYTSMILNIVESYQGKEQLEFIESFCDFVLDRSFIEFQNEEDIFAVFNDYMRELCSNIKYYDREIIKEYTGTLFRDVNAVLRNNWDYEMNGRCTKEREKDALEIANDMQEIFYNSGSYLPADIKVYRGVSISAFKKFGVRKLEDLVFLKGQYVFDSGFTSTSIIRGRSFFDRSLGFHDTCNIEIEYLVPIESNDGLPLITNSLTYSPVQTEFLINKGSLSKIVDVDIIDGKAYIKAIHIPQRVWDKRLDAHLSRRKK